MNTQALRRDGQATVGRTPAGPDARAGATQALDTRALFAGGSEVVITHGGEVYRLRLTRQNRLILTK